MRRALALLSLLPLTACSNTPSSLEVDITAGQEEATAWDGITSVQVGVTSLDGNVNQTTTVTDVPGGSFDFGNISNGEQITVTVKGFKHGTQVMSGNSLSGLLLDAIAGGSLPVFAARTGQWARPPGSFSSGGTAGGLARTHVGGAAAVQGGRFLLLAGGSPASKDTSSGALAVDGYDVFALDGIATSGAWSVTPATIVTLSSEFLLIGTSGEAAWFDMPGALPAPSGLCPPSSSGTCTFAGVAGGRVVTSSGGLYFVVGGARRGSASSDVLELDDSEDFAGLQLTAKRSGAAVTWIDNVGVVVAGGSATASGVEVLTAASISNGSPEFVSEPVVPDDVEGAAAITDGVGGLVLVGGKQGNGPAPTRTLDISSCSAGCKATPVDGAGLDVALENTVGFRLPNGTFLVIGDDLSGTGFTLAFIVDLGGANRKASVKAVPFHEPRKGATVIDAPNGTVAVMGGEDGDGAPVLSVEMFYPPPQ